MNHIYMNSKNKRGYNLLKSYSKNNLPHKEITFRCNYLDYEMVCTALTILGAFWGIYFLVKSQIKFSLVIGVILVSISAVSLLLLVTVKWTANKIFPFIFKSKVIVNEFELIYMRSNKVIFSIPLEEIKVDVTHAHNFLTTIFMLDPFPGLIYFSNSRINVNYKDGLALTKGQCDKLVRHIKIYRKNDEAVEICEKK